ncbi:hypothetical protein INR49_030021 [Caranx melampygus]|nr:hypothetical protein INR49_030021 [Caranx melampygus]
MKPESPPEEVGKGDTDALPEKAEASGEGSGTLREEEQETPPPLSEESMEGHQFLCRSRTSYTPLLLLHFPISSLHHGEPDRSPAAGGVKGHTPVLLPAFILLLLIYIFIMVSNLGLVVLITMERSLHQPMYLLFCNMSINDAFGASTIVPRILTEVFTPASKRYISYSECVTQAFCAHFHASATHTVLMIMAFDRYLAICNPLRYAAIMTNRMVVKLSAGAWAVALVMVLILVGLSVRLSRCRWIIFNPFCDNASLFKLSCESLLINQIYGLGYTVVLLGSSLGSVTLTYLKIATVCLSSRNKALNGRALQTCATHLAVYVIMFVSGSIIIILHRFPDLSDHRKMASIMFHVVPPALNAVIYGVQIKAVREKLLVVFTRNTTQPIDHGVQSRRNHMEHNGCQLPVVRQVLETMEDDDDVAGQKHDDVDGKESLNREALSQNGWDMTALQRDRRTLRLSRTTIRKKAAVHAPADSFATILLVMMEG